MTHDVHDVKMTHDVHDVKMTHVHHKTSHAVSYAYQTHIYSKHSK